MFAGVIPGITKRDAKEWAKETDFSKLPERAPAEKGKATLRSKKAEDEREDKDDKKQGHRRKIEEDDDKIAPALKQAAGMFGALERDLAGVFKFAALGTAAMNPGNVGKLRGMMTTHALKAPGYAASTQATNPARNVISAMNIKKPH